MFRILADLIIAAGVFVFIACALEDSWHHLKEVESRVRR